MAKKRKAAKLVITDERTVQLYNPSGRVVLNRKVGDDLISVTSGLIGYNEFTADELQKAIETVQA